MDYKNSIYYRVGRASDLTGADRALYRFFEMLPGILAWITIAGIFFLSFYKPFFCAVFIILFDVYWILKVAYLSIFLRNNWKKTRHNMSVDWKQMLANVKYDRIHHMVILPFYNESYEIVEKSFKAILDCEYDKKKFIVVLAGEDKNREHCLQIIEQVKKEFSGKFGHLFCTLHPAGILGEMPGKGSNIAYAAEQARKEIFDKNNIKYEDVLVSAFDIDTVAYPRYFECLTWNFLTCEDPLHSSFQPVPLFNNNIWQSPALSRVVAFSATFWQMIQQERLDRLVTFSSHSLCFKTLYDVGYWQKNMVSEDSRIFWNAFVANDGKYKVVPLCFPVSMDANLAPTFWQTAQNVYKQQRRWAYGVENGAYAFMAFVKNKNIPKARKLKFTFVLLEGYWSLATNPLVIFFLGWLPVVLGGREFNRTVLSYNLPIITRTLMTISMLGIFLSLTIAMSFLPKAPNGTKWIDKFAMFIQWILIPITVILFGAVPALEAQTRLMLGKYMGFWITPKHRKK